MSELFSLSEKPPTRRRRSPTSPFRTMDPVDRSLQLASLLTSGQRVPTPPVTY